MSPVWVIKTRLQLQHTVSPTMAVSFGGGTAQVQYRGFFHATRVIWQTEGLRGMFRVRAPSSPCHTLCVCAPRAWLGVDGPCSAPFWRVGVVVPDCFGFLAPRPFRARIPHRADPVAMPSL